MRNMFNKVIGLLTLCVVAVASATAQVTPPDLDDFATPIKESIWTYWGQILVPVAAVFGLFIGVRLVIALMRKLSKA